MGEISSDPILLTSLEGGGVKCYDVSKVAQSTKKQRT